MECPRCRIDNSLQAPFCGECGVRLGLRCAGCGAARMAQMCMPGSILITANTLRLAEG